MAHDFSGDKTDDLLYTFTKRQADLFIRGNDLELNMRARGDAKPNAQEITELQQKISDLVLCAEELTKRNVRIHLNIGNQHKEIERMVSEAIAKSEVLSARKLPATKKKLPFRRRLQVATIAQQKSIYITPTYKTTYSNSNTEACFVEMEKGAVGIGWGKAILFGEHFVVYGFPGIAASIELNTTCKFVKANPGDGITSNDLVSGEKIKYGQHKYKTLDRVIDAILKQTKIEERNFKLDLETNMSLKGGMGSSAALCVSITRCLSEQFSLKLSDEQVNRISFEAEKVFHSNPSGIDNTVSAYGGMIWFEKKQPINFIERMKSKPVEVVFADTGIFHNTAEIVAMVSHQKDADRKKYQRIFMDYKEIVYPARGLIEKGKWKEVGELMNKNQKLLEEINVSNEANDLLVQTSLQNGALGAKVTGAGLGGNVLALTPGQKLQEQVAKAIEREGFTAYKIKIGVNKNAI